MSRHLGKVLALVMVVAAGAIAPARAHDVIERVSVGPGGVRGDGFSGSPSISANGRIVAFVTSATNLLRDVGTGGFEQVIVRDRWTGANSLVSVGLGGVAGDSGGAAPRVSADGRVVAFTSLSTNLVPGASGDSFQIYVRVLDNGG